MGSVQVPEVCLDQANECAVTGQQAKVSFPMDAHWKHVPDEDTLDLISVAGIE